MTTGNKPNLPKASATETSALRLQAIKAVRKGVTVAEVARLFDVTERSMYRWLARFTNEGQRGLQTKERSGRPPKLTPEQMAKLGRIVQDKTPQQFKLPYALWTLSMIREVIRR